MIFMVLLDSIVYFEKKQYLCLVDIDLHSEDIVKITSKIGLVRLSIRKMVYALRSAFLVSR